MSPPQSVLLLGLAGVSVATIFLLYYVLLEKHRPKAALPATVKEIHEFDSGNSGVTMDYFYMLKARITEHEFAEYVSRMKLSPLEETQRSRPEKYHWGGHFDAGNKWWNPTESMVGAFHDRTAKGSKLMIAKYENGYLYFKESCGY